MKLPNRATLALASTALLLSISSASIATAHPTEEQFQAVHACAAKQGVNLPDHPPGPPPNRDQNGLPPGGGWQRQGQNTQRNDNDPKDNERGPPTQNGDHHPPRLTEEQRAVVEACFKANGITPPQHPPGGPNGAQNDNRPSPG